MNKITFANECFDSEGTEQKLELIISSRSEYFHIYRFVTEAVSYLFSRKSDLNYLKTFLDSMVNRPARNNEVDRLYSLITCMKGIKMELEFAESVLTVNEPSDKECIFAFASGNFYYFLHWTCK